MVCSLTYKWNNLNLNIINNNYTKAVPHFILLTSPALLLHNDTNSLSFII